MYKAMVVGMLAFGASCTYRMGRGLPMDPSLALGEIQAATSIQGAEEALSQALVRELARRSGRGAPQVVNLELLHLEDAPSASGSRQSRLRLAIALSSDGDHRVERRPGDRKQPVRWGPGRLGQRFIPGSRLESGARGGDHGYQQNETDQSTNHCQHRFVSSSP